MGQLGFSDLDERYRSLDAKKDPLVFLNEVVPWEDFRARLSAVWRKPEEERKNAAGRKPWDEIVIFQTLVLQALSYVRLQGFWAKQFSSGPCRSVRGDDIQLHGMGDGALRRRSIKLLSAGWLPHSVFRPGASPV